MANQEANQETSSETNPWRLPLVALLVIIATAFITASFYRPKTESERILEKKPSLVQPAAPLGDRVCIISVDGLRPDLLLRADSPMMHSLINNGAFSMWAQTTDMAVTLPSHSSMITGVAPEKHGVTWNKAPPKVAYPKYPTLMELARKQRPELTSALIAAKFKFNALTRSTDWNWLPPNDEANAENSRIAEEAVRIINEHAPNILYVHFGDVDQIGHFDSKIYPRDIYPENFGGWGSPAQLDAIATADQGIAQVLSALKKKDLLKDTLVIVSADHGGRGFVHGADDARSRHIPWIVYGPGVRRGFDLTRIDPLMINTEDTFATASYFLGIPMAPDIDGRPVLEIFEPPPSTAPSSAAATTAAK